MPRQRAVAALQNSPELVIADSIPHSALRFPQFSPLWKHQALRPPFA
jgi:hypothetical protein